MEKYLRTTSLNLQKKCSNSLKKKIKQLKRKRIKIIMKIKKILGIKCGGHMISNFIKLKM